MMFSLRKKGCVIMQLQESGEMYLETIYVLSQEKDNVRSLDIAEHMGFSKPSVSRAVKLLKANDYIYYRRIWFHSLNFRGLSIAAKVFERHTLCRICSRSLECQMQLLSLMHVRLNIVLVMSLLKP